MMNEFADKIEVACMDAGLAVRCTGGTLTPRFISYCLITDAPIDSLRQVLSGFRLRQPDAVVVLCEVPR